MSEKKINYITKRALQDLPDDTPIYVLLDNEDSDFPKVEDKGVIPQETDEKLDTSFVDKIYDELCNEDDKDIINDSIIEEICNDTSNQNDFCANLMKLCSNEDDNNAIYNDLDDEFVLTIDVETSNLNSRETPDHLTQFYDSLYNEDDQLEEVEITTVEDDLMGEEMDIESVEQQDEEEKELDMFPIDDSYMTKQNDNETEVDKIKNVIKNRGEPLEVIEIDDESQNNNMVISPPLMSPLPINNETPLKHHSPILPPLNFSFTSLPPPGYQETLSEPPTPEKKPVCLKSEKYLNKLEEVQKIKQRRRMNALKEPRRSMTFKVISRIEMDLNEKYLIYTKKGKKGVVGTKAMKELENEFEKKILKRSKEAVENCAEKWEPLKRDQVNYSAENIDDKIELFSDSDEEDDDSEPINDISDSDDDSLTMTSTDEEDDSSSTRTPRKDKSTRETELIASSSVHINPGASCSDNAVVGGGVFTEFQLKQLAKIEKKVAATRKKLNLQYGSASSSNKAGNKDDESDSKKQSDTSLCKYACRKRCRHGNSNKNGHPSPAKKPKQSIDYRTIQENKLANNAPIISAGRSIQQQTEINHKLAHPRKLHADIWYNERNELNDGPSCCCHPKSKIGPLHNDFPGEIDHPITPCISNSNNFRSLYHYRMIINPAINFLSPHPTIIQHQGRSYCFSGFSIFTHKALVDLPVCQVVRYNIIYQLSLISDPFPVGFTVKSLDLITEYLFTNLLEMLDVEWFPNVANGKKSCRSIHLMPRFEWTPDNHVETEENTDVKPVVVKMLSTDVILQWLLDNGTQPLFDIIDLPRLQSMSLSEWSEYIDQLRGTLTCYPGKKPSTIRIDQLDRESLDLPRTNKVITFPVIVHMNMVPLKLGLTREPAYKRLLKNFLKLQYLILNRPEITKEDRTELNNLARLLENFELNGIQRREFTVEICSDGFFRTGLKTDVVQCALCIPSLMSHIRFHFSLSELEDRIKYSFKDKSLLHQALTHPSYLNTNYGTNPDHYQNTNVTCGLRHIQYGDKISLYRSFRKKGLSKMVQVMSYMPFKHETRSTIFGNERLECLGDAVIELITSVHLFYMFPELSEGHLDSFRQALVQNHYLANLAVRLGLHQYLLYTHNTDFSFDSTITHARSDAFEAIMAAITLDGGLNEADRIFGSVLFGDDLRINRVWCELPDHQLQEQFPKGDRHVIHNSPILKNLTNLEERLGIKFKHIRLLAKAMTIRKTGYNIFTLGDNQRLEFLGDSLLKYVSTDYLFKHFPRHHEGHLSLLRNTLVNRYTQARVCRELGLDEFIIRKDGQSNSSGHVSNNINGVKNMTPQQQKCSQKPHADLLEAFLGALFIDKDLTWVERFCQVCFWPRLVHFILNQKWNDPKSRLQQCCLTYRSINEDPEIAYYKLISTYGSTDNREFKVAVYFRGVRMATGFGSSIQIAEMNAATKALDNYKDNFKQLNYQEKILDQQYNTGVRKKMLKQFETWDKNLVDRFTGKQSPTLNSDKRIHSMTYKNKNEDKNGNKKNVTCETKKPETKDEQMRNLQISSTLGGLIKNNGH